MTPSVNSAGLMAQAHANQQLCSIRTAQVQADVQV